MKTVTVTGLAEINCSGCDKVVTAQLPEP